MIVVWLTLFQNIKAAKSAFLPVAERDALVKQLEHAYGQ